MIELILVNQDQVDQEGLTQVPGVTRNMDLGIQNHRGLVQETEGDEHGVGLQLEKKEPAPDLGAGNANKYLKVTTPTVS